LSIIAKPFTTLCGGLIKKNPILIIFERQMNRSLHIEFYIEKTDFGQIIKRAVNITAKYILSKPIAYPITNDRIERQ